MAALDPSTPQLDGIGPTVGANTMVRREEGQKPPPLSSEPKRSFIKSPLLLLIVAAVAYLLPATVVTSILPTGDGSLAGLALGSSAFYLLGGVLWLLFGAIGFVRIGMIKDAPRTTKRALVRLVAMVVPMVAASGAVILLVNRQPGLSIDVVSPTDAQDLIAPITVTFGSETALKVFAADKRRPLKFEWDFNADGKADQVTYDGRSTYIFQKAGIYTIAERITMADGSIQSSYRRLVISRESFGVGPESPIIDEAARFTIEHLIAKKEDIGMVRWDFDGDGTTDLETANPTASYTYHRLGTFVPSVTLTYANRTQTVLNRTIEVVSAPVPPFPVTLETEPTTLLGTAPFGVVFVVKTEEPVANVTWDFGDQKGSDVEGLRVAHTYDVVGSFVTQAMVRSQSGATAKLTKVIRITNPLNLPDLGFDGTPEVRNFTIEGEVPLTLDITPVTSQPLVTFSWDAPGANEVLSTNKTLKAIYRKEGKYTVDIIGIDPDQNVLRKRIAVTVKPPSSSVKFSVNPPDPIAPATVKFDATDSFISPDEEISGFVWDFGDGAFNNQPQFSGSRTEHVYEKPGTYTIGLTVQTTKGNSYDAKKSLVVRAPLVDACFLSSRSSGSAPLGVSFSTDCSTGTFTSWTWDFGDQSQSDQKNPTHVYLNPGEYRVTLTATTASGIKSDKNTTITVTAPSADASPSSDK